MDISLAIEQSLMPAFFKLLQEGFWIQGNVGSSVRSFLCEQFGVTPEYLEKRIQTIFLNGSAVDDVDNATVENGTTLSLSAALPGLAGAVLRRGGYYAAMRDEISCKEGVAAVSLKPGKVLMKLFNMPLQELGPAVMERGVWIEGERVRDVLKARADAFQAGCKAVMADGREFTLNQLLEMDWGRGDIFLQVKII